MGRERIKTTKESTESMAFSEVKTVYNDEQCNELVAKGWTILHVGCSHIDANGYNAKPTFIMGKPK